VLIDDTPGKVASVSFSVARPAFIASSPVVLVWVPPWPFSSSPR